MIEAVCNLGMCHLCAGGYPDDPCEHECHRGSDGYFIELGQKNFHAPHCNASMLHAPGECYYCDHYPGAQLARILKGEPFTPNESNGWSGNVAVKAGELHNHMGIEYNVGARRADGGWPIPQSPRSLPLTEQPRRTRVVLDKLKRLFRRTT